jgi:hypothetical protein
MNKNERQTTRKGTNESLFDSKNQLVQAVMDLQEENMVMVTDDNTVLLI